MNTPHPSCAQNPAISSNSRIAALNRSVDYHFRNVADAIESDKEAYFSQSCLASIILNTQWLLEAAQELQGAIQAGQHTAASNAQNPAKTAQSGTDAQTVAQTIPRFQIEPPRRISLGDAMRTLARQRGLEPMPLEVGLLLKRVAQGGHSGQYLADAFLSAYRTDQPFFHSLGDLAQLDAEGFGLFHQILHIRHVPGWQDDDFYQLEQQVKAILRGGVNDGCYHS